MFLLNRYQEEMTSLLKVLSLVSQLAFFRPEFYREETASENQAGLTPALWLGLLGNKFLGLILFGPDLYMLIEVIMLSSEALLLV